MLLREVGGEIWGTYSYDQGTVRGTFTDGHFVGYWYEVPTRMGPSDAGDVIFDFIPNGDGTYHIDGRWRYANEIPDGAYRENWDLTTVSATEPPADLVARFDDPSAFPRHP